MQQQLYEKNQYNIVRIIKGKTAPCNNSTDNQYTRAADYLRKWIEEGALKQDSQEAIYAYVQDFEVAGAKLQRFSFIALTKLEEFGETVRPHEQILEKPIIDRLNLKRATAAKFGLVFMLYEDKKKIADKIIEKSLDGEPVIDFSDEQDVRHRLFTITDEDDIEKIAEMMKQKNCIIADGHHRYTTDLTYARENPDASRYQMMAFANTQHEGLVVLATHRLISNLENFDTPDLITKLKDNFEITEYPFDSDDTKTEAKQRVLAQMKLELCNDRNAFGIYGGGRAFYVAALKDKKAMNAVAPDMSTAWRSLDVSVLHKLILEKLLGLDEQKLGKGENLEYVKDTPNAIDDSIAKVDSGGKQVVFFMNPPKIEQIHRVADQGERMPQKSTYFYPKVYTGLTINKL